MKELDIKNLIEPLNEAIVPMNRQVEKAERKHRTNMCLYVPAWANIAVCQQCRERQPLWNSHDGLNLTCLDRCDGVRSHGTSSSQGWRKRIVVQSLNLIHEFAYLFSLKVICAGSLRKGFPQKHAFVDISAFLWLRKQQPRFAQGQRTGYYQMKELNLIEPLKPLCDEWNVEKAAYQHAPMCAFTCQHGPTLQFVSCAEKDSLCGTVMMAWT